MKTIKKKDLLRHIKINALQVMVEEIHDYKEISNVTAKFILVSIFFVVFYFFSSCSNSPGRGDWFTLYGFSFRHGPLVSTTTITVGHSKSLNLFKNIYMF